MASNAPHGARYHRISDDREGLERGITRQMEDTEHLAALHGITVPGHLVFTDNDIGASTRSKKPRPAYRAMLDAVARGEVGTIFVYSNSRLTRRPLELEDLIRLHEQTGVVIKTLVSGDDDLSTADGRMVARIKASVDAAEAERTGERVTRQHAANRKAGVPVGGTRPFGWQDDKRTLHPRESAIVRRIVDDIIGGESVRNAVRHLNASGFTTTMGNRWEPQALTQYLRNPRLVGHRTHRKQVVLDEAGLPVVGQWEPLLDPDQWDRLQLILGGRARAQGKASREGRRKYLLTGTIRCGLCHGFMYGNGRSENLSYRYICESSTAAVPHTVGIAGPSLDRMIERLVLAKMSATADVETVAPEWGGAARTAELEGLIEVTLAQLDKGKIAPERIFGQVEKFESELARLHAERAVWIAATVGPTERVLSLESWSALDTARKRWYVQEYLTAVYVKVATRPKRWDPERVVPVWRETPRPAG